MDKWEQTTEACLKEMFKRVGETYPNPRLTNYHEWYTVRTWTEAEEDDFRQWMKKLLIKRHRVRAKTADYETGMFLLNWGWKCSDMGSAST